MNYYIHTATVDGEKHRCVAEMAIQQFLKELQEEAKDCELQLYFCRSFSEFTPNNVPDDIEQVLIIRGTVVTPRPKEVVTKWEL